MILPVFAGQVLLSCVAARRPQPLTPEVLLDAFLSQPIPISYAAQLKLWVKVDRKGRGKSKMEVFRNSTGFYSFSAKDLWGRDAMTAIIKPDSILVYYPQEDRFIRNSIERFTASDYWEWNLSPRELLEIIDGGWIRNLGEVTVRPDQKDCFSYWARKGVYEVNFDLSKSEGILRDLMLFHPQGDTVQVKFKGTREYKGYLRPKLVEIRLSGSASLIKIGILEEQFNLELPESYFSIDLPRTAQRIPLD